MATRRARPSAAVWALAGVPVVVTLLQAVLAAFETSGYAVFGGLVDVVHAIEVFDRAAPVFRESPVLAFALFALIAAAWAAQGAAMFVVRHRDATFAAAGLVSILFFALFLGVYSPLLGAGLPALQVAGFFAIPVVAAAAAVAAAFVHDWEVDVEDEALETLAAAEADVDGARDAFDRELDRRVGDVADYESLAPEAAGRARERADEFRARCDDVVDAVEDVRQRGGDADEVRRRASDIRERAGELDPESAAAAVEDVLREGLAAAAREEFGEVRVWSRWDRSYELVNLPARLRNVRVAAFDAEIHVDHLDDAVTSRLDDGVTLPTVRDGMAEMRDHVERVEAHVDDEEADFAAVTESVEDDLDTVEEKVEQLPGAVRERATELLVEGRGDGASVHGVRETLSAARDRLHDCRFDDARRLATEASEAAGDLVQLVEFLRSVEGSIDHRAGSVSVPAGVDASVVADAALAFEREHDVEFEVADRTIHVGYGDEDPRARSTEKPADAGSSQESARPEEVIDAVLFVVRELENAAASTDGEIQLQTRELPESVRRPAVLAQIERFAKRQTDVVSSVAVPEDGSVGYLTVEPEDGVAPTRAAATLHERYRDRYGSE